MAKPPLGFREAHAAACIVSPSVLAFSCRSSLPIPAVFLFDYVKRPLARGAVSFDLSLRVKVCVFVVVLHLVVSMGIFADWPVQPRCYFPCAHTWVPSDPFVVVGGRGLSPSFGPSYYLVFLPGSLSCFEMHPAGRGACGFRLVDW